MPSQKELVPLSKIEQALYDKLLTGKIDINTRWNDKTFSPRIVIEADLDLMEDGIDQIPEYRKAEIFGRVIIDMCKRIKEEK